MALPPRAIDPSGGLFHFFCDQGEVYDRHTCHLVSSTRFVVTAAISHRATGNPADLERLHHAMAFAQRTPQP